MTGDLSDAVDRRHQIFFELRRGRQINFSDRLDDDSLAVLALRNSELSCVQKRNHSRVPKSDASKIS